MSKLLVICGPTATGKTKLTVKLAKKFSSRGRPASGWSGEIISADSRQVYRGMDIGTGKDLPKNYKFKISNLKFGKLNLGYYLFDGVPVWLLDVVEPNQEFSVAQYYRLVWKVIKKIWQKKKLPILAGGTGFYIRAVIDGVETKDIPRNLALRAEIKDWPKEKLFARLNRLDPEKSASMNWSDKNNPYRLVRAIEVAVYKKENSRWQPKKHPQTDNLFVGLTAPYKVLDQKIHQRVKKRLGQDIEKEIKGLLDKGYTWESSALGDTIGYREWRDFFEDKKTKKEVIALWETSERQYARKQMTWFRKDKRIRWFDISQKGWQNKVEALVKQWYD